MKTRICIDVSEDGQMSIGIEPEGEEMAEGEAPQMGQPGMGGAPMEEEGGEGYMTPVANEEELMVKLTELLQQSKNPTGEAEADAAFNSGYAEAGGPSGVRGMEGLM